ncbi:MAG TPA: hypothetical protein VF625_09705 [Longimicrobium sp.]|jgi:hypothetical protein
MGIIQLQPDEPFVFMKVGRHAGEDLGEILARKQLELERAGVIFWGYGGRTMHPIQKVQPFVRSRIEHTGQIKLLMQTILSRHPDTAAVATEFSRDGVHWEPVPEGVEVRGSKYALVLGEIQSGDGMEVDFGAYKVGAGPSSGRAAGDYIKGRVDKGLLDPATGEAVTGAPRVPIHYAAQMAEPYAVLLRST